MHEVGCFINTFFVDNVGPLSSDTIQNGAHGRTTTAFLSRNDFVYMMTRLILQVVFLLSCLLCFFSQMCVCMVFCIYTSKVFFVVFPSWKM